MSDICYMVEVQNSNLYKNKSTYFNTWLFVPKHARAIIQEELVYVVKEFKLEINNWPDYVKYANAHNIPVLQIETYEIYLIGTDAEYEQSDFIDAKKLIWRFSEDLEMKNINK